MPQAFVHAYPHSLGTAMPRWAVPVGACDAHMHIFDPQWAPADGGAACLPGATVADYQQLQRRLGTQRTVVVQPRSHGTDNRVTLAAIQALGAACARGVAVVHPSVSDDELAQLHAGGIRGIRFTLFTPAHAVVDFGMVEPLAHRVASLGWHVQLHWTAAQVVEHAALLARLPCTLVFDHLARLPLPQGRAHPAYTTVRRLVDSGRTWIKLSGAYLDSKVGARGGYADLDAIACGWTQDAPERVVWGSDWPHTTEQPAVPDDAALLDLLARWVPDLSKRRRVLVDNPAVLYGFPAVAETAIQTTTTETKP